MTLHYGHSFFFSLHNQRKSFPKISAPIHNVTFCSSFPLSGLSIFVFLSRAFSSLFNSQYLPVPPCRNDRKIMILSHNFSYLHPCFIYSVALSTLYKSKKSKSISFIFLHKNSILAILYLVFLR